MAYYIKVRSCDGTNVEPEYWSRQIVSTTQSNLFYNLGNVGFGVPNPLAKLQVDGNVGIGTAYSTIAPPIDGLIVSGYVGIGTSLPLSRMHVNGSLIADGSLITALNGTMVTTGTVAIARGGTGATTITGGGANVLATAPTLVTPILGAATGTSLAVSGNITTSAGKFGYTTGGVVSQATSRTTGVTLNASTGQITLFTTTLAANTATSFTLTNSFISANDHVLVTQVGGTTALYICQAVAASGSATIYVRNPTATISASEAPVLKFSIISSSIA